MRSGMQDLGKICPLVKAKFLHNYFALLSLILVVYYLTVTWKNLGQKREL